MKVMKIIDISDEVKIRIESGIQATAGIGRSSSSGGSSRSDAARERPIAMPSAIPSSAAAP